MRDLHRYSYSVLLCLDSRFVAHRAVRVFSAPAPNRPTHASPPAHPFRLALALIAGGIAALLSLALSNLTPSIAQAAPSARPLLTIITGTTSITHTANTTHQMHVYGNGRITNRFLTPDGSEGGRNQIDQDGGDPNATTIAVLFDQHAWTTNTVDVGAQGEFEQITPITLQTASTMPGFIEDTYVVYASRVLSYQIAQQTLASASDNCVVMRLSIRNTSSAVTLTGGILLYMVDIDVAHNQTGDLGFYDLTRRLVYQTDYNNASPHPGFAMGVSLLEGSWRGYSVLGGSGYPTLDADIAREMITPTNVVTNGNNDVSVVVANIPDLNPGEDAVLAFGLCAMTAETEAAAAAAMIEGFDRMIRLSAAKTATPIAGSSVAAGDLITYSVLISNTGCWPVHNIMVTDAIPLPTELVTYAVSQGSITAGDRLVTATIGSLDPQSGTVTLALVVRPSITLTHGTVISNQAHVRGNCVITNTNVVTHQIVNAPVLTITKHSEPAVSVGAGERLTYTIVVSADGQGYANGVVVSDTLPANTQFVPDSISLTPPDAGVVGTAPPTLATGLIIQAGRSVTVTFAVTVSAPLTAGTVITNVAAVTSTAELIPKTAIVTNTVLKADLAIAKYSTPKPATFGEAITYTIIVSNPGQSHVVGAVVSDVIPSDIGAVSWTCSASSGSACTTSGFGDIADTVTLLAGGRLTYTVTGTLSPGAPATLVNTATVTVSPGITDVAPADNTAVDINIPLSRVNLRLSKSGIPATAAPGGAITYTIVVSNSGEIEATGSVVSDTLPENTSFVPGSITLDPPGAGMPGTAPPILASGLTIPAGQEVTVTFVVTVATPLMSGTVITNTASVTCTQRPVPVQGTVTNTVIGTPRVSIAKDGPANATVGSTAVFTFTVSNPGNTPLRNVTVQDNVAGLAVYMSGDDGDGWLESHETWIYTAGYVVQPDDPNLLTNTATVTATDALGVPASASASHTTDVAFAPVLTITKSGPPWGGAGQTLTFTFTVSHTPTSDGSPVGNLAVSDSLAGTATYVGGDGDGDGRLDLGETWTYTANYTVQPADPDPLPNTATVTGTDGDGDPLSASATHSTPIARLVASKSSQDANDPLLYPGDTLIYSVVVTNTSVTLIQTNVTITDTVPLSTTLVGGSAQSNGSVSELGSTVVARIAQLTPGQVLTLTFRVTVNPATHGQVIVNQAEIASEQLPSPPQPPPTTDVVASTGPALTFAKWASPEAARSRDTWTQYHFQVSNSGTVTLIDIQVVDNRLGVVGNAASLAPGESALFTRWVPISADTYNVATATAQAPGYPGTISASDDAFFDVIEGLSLVLDVSVEPQTIAARQVVTYAFTLTNTSSDWMVNGVITDTVYGEIAGGLTLAPGAVYTRVLTKQPTFTTTNTAFARGRSRLGDVVTASDSATVIVIPNHILYLPLVARQYTAIPDHTLHLPLVMRQTPP